jgi:hypothetical protein
MAEQHLLAYESSKRPVPRPHPKWISSYIRFLLDVLSVLALMLCAVVMPVWLLSYSTPDLPSDPQTGFSPTRPPHAIPLPLPSDAQEYLVPLRGRLERWEYAPWERRWYRLKGGGSSLNQALALLLAVLCARLLFGKLFPKNAADEAFSVAAGITRDRCCASPAPGTRAPGT